MYREIVAMPTDEERREIARKLRKLSHGYVTVGDYREAIGMDDRPNLEYDEVTGEPVLRKIDLDDTSAEMLRLADLIEPAGNGLVAEDNLKLIERCRELECELARAKAELGKMKRERGGITDGEWDRIERSYCELMEG